MDRKDIKLYDVLTNTASGNSGLVVEAEQWKTVIKYPSGEKAQIAPAYFQHASAEVAAGFEAMREQDKRDRLTVGTVGDAAPADVRSELQAYLKAQFAKYPEAEKPFNAFWGRIMDAIGDKPGNTWDMRRDSKRNNCPVLKATKTSTGNLVIVLYVFVGSKIRMEMKKDFLPERYKHLFPNVNTMHKMCDSVKLEWSDLKGGAGASYIDCIREACSGKID